MKRVMLVLCGCVLALVVVELLLWAFLPNAGFGAARQLEQFEDPGVAGAYELDPSFGFRPVLGEGRYSRFGTVTNAYRESKPQGVRRVLFIGDSVTARGRIVAGLRKLYGEEGMEYWNAGVESFNTVQEAEYYKRYNMHIRPDHVVLTFHLNDFESTPVVFRRRDGGLTVYAPNMPTKRLNLWLFRHSRLYRMLAGSTRGGDASLDAIVAETHASVVDLKAVADACDARLTVLVLPYLKPEGEWSAGDQYSRRLILEILTEVKIPFVDLWAPVQEALAEGIDVTEAPDDFWHPSQAVADRMAAYIKARGVHL